MSKLNNILVVIIQYVVTKVVKNDATCPFSVCHHVGICLNALVSFIKLKIDHIFLQLKIILGNWNFLIFNFQSPNWAIDNFWSSLGIFYFIIAQLIFNHQIKRQKKFGHYLEIFNCLIDNGTISTIDPRTTFFYCCPK